MFLGSSAMMRMRGGVASDLIAVSGDLALAGSLQISLAPGTSFGRYPLFTYGGNLAMGSVTLSGIPGGTTAQLSISVTGQVSLVIDDSDEDGLPDSWEVQYLGNLSKGAGDDSDGDGQTNAVEYRTGTMPNNGASLFAVSMAPVNSSQFTLTWPSVPGKMYKVQSTATLAGTWNNLAAVPAASSPATTTSYPITKSDSRSFYRVALEP
jgi:hypothetical protein